jgi:hypothetical protein
VAAVFAEALEDRGHVDGLARNVRNSTV